MKDRKQSSTSYPITFLLVSSSDHISPVTGASPTVTISKNGAAFAAPSGAVTEIGNGWYQLAGNSTDRNTLGVLLVHATATGADPCDDRYNIVPWDPFDANLALANLNAPVGSIPTNPFLATSDFNASQKTSLNAATPASVQNIAAQTGDAYARIGAAGAGLTALGDTRLANLDATVSSRLAPGGTLATVTNLINAPTSGDLTATMKTSVENAVWDAARANHATAGTFSLVNQAVADGTAQGGSSNTITLASASKGTDQYYTGDLLYVYAGPGAGQSVIISNYIGSSKVATVSPPWDTAPTAASKYVITMSMSPIVGSDVKTLISADAQDLSATFKVDAKVVEDKAGYSLGAAYDAAKTAASASAVAAIPTNPLLASGYTAPDNSDIAAIKADVENATYGLNALLAAITAGSGSSAPSAATVAAAVWDTAITGHLTAGTTGSALNAAGSAGDPWSTILPGVYGAGTAGSIIGSRLDAAVSSRNAVAPDNAGISSIISALNDGVHGLAALLTVVNSRLAATAYTAPDNTDVAAIKADVESVAYGLAAIKASLGSISLDLSPVTSRLDSGTYGLAAIKSSITDISDPLATVVEGSDPPMTRGQAIDQLYIADYVGPVRTIPAAPSPEQQTLYGFAREFAANVWSAGDVATMTINPNNSDSAGTILKPWVATATVDANGMFSFTPDKGAQNVTVKLTPAGGGQPYYRKTIPVISQDDEKNVTAY
jgi:hypothetical protein